MRNSAALQEQRREVGLQLLFAELDLREEGLRRDQRLRHFAPLLLQRGEPLGDAARDDGAIGDGARELRQRQVEAQPRLEHLRRHVLRAQQRLVVRAGEGAVGLERGDGGDGFAQLVVAHRQVPARRGVGHQALRHQRLEQRTARLRRVERGRVEAAAEGCAQAFLLALQLLGELALRDPPAVDRGDLVAPAGRAGVGLEPEERERRHDQQHERDLDQALVLLYESKHEIAS
jgi:hypothetical protein